MVTKQGKKKCKHPHSLGQKIVVQIPKFMGKTHKREILRKTLPMNRAFIAT